MLALLHHNNIGPHHHEEGFTLIETMVALAIFLIGIIGCYTLQIRSSSSNALANSVGASATWATYAVEGLLAKDYADPDFNDDGPPAFAGIAGLDATEGNADGVLYIRPDGSTSAVAAANDLYSVSWNIVEGTAAAAGSGQPVLAGTKQVRVVVIKKAGIGSGIHKGTPLAGVLYTHDYFKTSNNL